jgi:hypothetical protein
MTKRKPKEFGADWPREELLAYDINGYVTNTLGCIEILHESKPNLNPRDAKLWKIMAQSMKAARPKAQELCQLFHAQRKPPKRRQVD